MKCPPLFLSATSLLAVLLAGTGCKSTAGKEGSDEKAAQTESDKDKAKRTAAETVFYEECAKLGSTGGTVTGRDGWLFSAGELLQVSRIPAIPQVLSDDGTWQAVSVPYTRFIAGRRARFVRLTVSMP